MHLYSEPCRKPVLIICYRKKKRCYKELICIGIFCTFHSLLSLYCALNMYVINAGVFMTNTVNMKLLDIVLNILGQYFPHMMAVDMFSDANVLCVYSIMKLY
jgi:hypothetical protein